MRILVVGGTSFIGRAIAWSAWHHAHTVTVLNRGRTASDLPGAVEHLVGDRHGDLSALAGRDFDATIDVIAYRPVDVDRLADALGERGGRHLQVSSVSAYRDPERDGATEDDLELWDDAGLDPASDVTAATYGPLKAACERAARRRFGDDVTIVRPTYVIGAHDHTLRFPYWVARVRRGGEVAAPGPREARLQWIDARDLAEFSLGVLEDGLTGPFHVAAPPGGAPFVEVIERVAAHAAPPGTRVLEVPAEAVLAAGLASRFPLWSPRPEALSTLDTARARAAGLVARPLEESVDDVLEWWGARPGPDHWLSPEDEARLLATSR
ncbi:MAG TPA: NAD-dependent epimerase/dehydratase family protein [Acidimicrobiales bacterium]|nr:NAD-dependent epimerase/dehydratase family protein [Acidimicrobiales bacterium]